MKNTRTKQQKTRIPKMKLSEYTALFLGWDLLGDCTT